MEAERENWRERIRQKKKSVFAHQGTVFFNIRSVFCAALPKCTRGKRVAESPFDVYPGALLVFVSGQQKVNVSLPWRPGTSGFCLRDLYMTAMR